MTFDSDKSDDTATGSVPNSLRVTGAIFAGYAIVGGAVSLLGWILDIPRLTDWENRDVSIQGNTAALLILCGLGILLSMAGFRKMVMALGALVTVIGILLVTQTIMGIDLGINHQLLFGRTWGQSTTVTAGRMGPPASVSFLLIGIAIFLLGKAEIGSALRRWIPRLAATVSVICAFSLLGYLFGARHFYAIPWRTAIALQTSTMLLSISVALTALVYEQHPVRMLRENSAAGLLARRVLPLLIIVPPAASFLRLKGEEMGLYDSGTGVVLVNLVYILVCVGIMWSALLIVTRQEQKVRDADRRKDEFLATLAHELRNPLAPMVNAVDVLRLEGSGAREMEWARDVMGRQLQQMSRLVDDLLDVSRISRGKIDLQRQTVDLSHVLERAVETSRPLIDRNRHRLDVSLPEHPVYINADTVRMAQVFSNLLNNAAKFSDAGGHITLHSESRDGYVVVRVKDTGVGIPADKLPHVFELFTQVDQSIGKSHDGLGIGLTLVERLVHLHGGSVNVYSDGPGKGCEFAVRLPLASAPRLHEKRHTPAAPPRTIEAAELSGCRRILIADDNRDAAESLAIMLRSSENEIRTAFDGAEALAVASEFNPHVALLDIGLPKLSGYDVARRIRQTNGSGTTLLIAVTGWGQEEDRRRTKEAGFDHHLVKPVAPQKIMELLMTERAIGRSND